MSLTWESQEEREKKKKNETALSGLKIVKYMNSLLMHFDLGMQRSHFILKSILMLK